MGVASAMLSALWHFIKKLVFSARLDVHKHLMQPEVQRTAEEPFLFLLEQTKSQSYSRKG